MQFFFKSKPISVGVSTDDRLNYIAYIIGKVIKYPKLSQLHGLCQFYFNRVVCRDRKLPLAPSYENNQRVFVCLLFFLESKTRQLNFEGCD